jgi:hypothetical protein
MVINCNVPSLNGLDDSQKLAKMEKYLWELNDQLRFILSNLEVDNFTPETREQLQLTASGKKELENTVQQSINTVKQKIINTSQSIVSDIESIRETMKGQYEAISAQFGTYTADFFRETTKNALSTIEEFRQIENINGYYVNSQGYIKTGNIGTAEDGTVIYGIEIGDVQSDNGTKLRMSNNQVVCTEQGTEIWSIKNRAISIPRAIISEYIYFGGYRIEVTNGIEFKWEG